MDIGSMIEWDDELMARLDTLCSGYCMVNNKLCIVIHHSLKHLFFMYPDNGLASLLLHRTDKLLTGSLCIAHTH